MDKIGKNNSQPAEEQENGMINFDHPAFKGITETAKAYIRKNATSFQFIGGKWHVNPQILMVAGYSEGSNETSPGYQASRSKDLKIRRWEESISGKVEEKTNENSSSRRNISAYIHDFNVVGYRHGEIEIRYVGGDKMLPALWVESGRHRVVAAKEGNLNWIPFVVITDKVMASVQDLRSNMNRNNLSIAALAEQIHNLYGKSFNGEKLTIEKISELTGISEKECTVYNTVMRDIIPEIREVASNETPNCKGKYLSFTTSLSKIAGALPASANPEFARQQRELLSSWLRGEIPDIEDYCKALKRQRTVSSQEPVSENVSSEETKPSRKGRSETAIYSRLGGMSGTEWRHLALGGIPNDLSLNSEEVSQLMLAVLGYSELPDKLLAAKDSFDFEGFKKTSSKKEKPRVQGEASTVKLPKELQITSFEDLQSVFDRMNTSQTVSQPEAPSEASDLSFLEDFFQKESPSGDNF